MNKDSALATRYPRPYIMLDTLKHALGADMYLLKYLPVEMVDMIAHGEAKEGHIPYKIEFGMTFELQDVLIKVYAYMSTTARKKDLPEIRFYGRTFHGSLVQYRLETVLSEGKLHEVFEPVKNLTVSAILVLLQVCLKTVSICFIELIGNSACSSSRAHLFRLAAQSLRGSS
jgi:hypothetical protein